MKFLLPVLSLILYLATTAQPRFTDSSFGTNGKVVENTSVPDVDIIDALLQPDGKTITLTTADYNRINRTVLIRYNTDGSPDGNFSGDGIADILISASVYSNAKAMRLQPDGKILVCGDTGYYYTKGFVVRHNTDGSLDAAFGTNGILYLPAFSLGSTTFSLPTVNNLTVLPGGKIMLLCTRSYPDNDFALIRLNSNGTFDNSFGTNGIVTANPLRTIPDYKSPTYTHIEVLPNGKYMVGGNPGIYASATSAKACMVARLNADGTIDNSFGTSGYFLPSGMAATDVLQDMVVQTDGKTVICGPQNAYGFRLFTTIIRITASGALDATFGSGGRRIIYTTATGFATIKPHLGLQTDAKILIGGIAKNSMGNYAIAVARLTTTGALDASFDGDGIALLQVNGYNSYGYVPLQQTDGKIIVAGYARNNTIQSSTIGRFTATGQTDASLNTAESITLLNNGPDDESGLNLLLQPADQKTVVVRERSNGFNYDLCVSRHLPNGQPDLDFGTNGKTFLDLPGEYYEVYSGLSADGKITVMPDFTDYTSFGALALYRLKADGQPDSSFGQYGKKIFKSGSTDTSITALSSAVVQPDGKIVMRIQQGEGYPNPNYSRDSAFIIRLNADGSFDNSFNGNGKKYTLQGYGLLLVQPDGKIIISRNDTSTGSYGMNSFISRLNVDGSVDATFNKGLEKKIEQQISQGALQPDGKILLSNSSRIVRLTGGGSLDSSFGKSGIADISQYYPDNKNGSTYLSNIRVNSNRIVLAGRLRDYNFDEYVFKVVVLRSNGMIDSSFGESGVVISTFFSNGNGEQIALQADERIVMTGLTDAANSDALVDFALTRLKGTNAPARLYTFTGNGLWSNAANWADGVVPPTTIPAGSSIVIDPPAGGECVIDISVEVKTGATIVIKAGKKVRLPGSLMIQ